MNMPFRLTAVSANQPQLANLAVRNACLVRRKSLRVACRGANRTAASILREMRHRENCAVLKALGWA
jgi:hypothetical protein